MLRVFGSLARLLHALFVLIVAAFVVVPNVPSSLLPLSDPMGRWAEMVSFKQGWKMYAPNPPRTLSYMNLTAVYHDGSSKPLEETAQEALGWGVQWMWMKTRVDIWQQYVVFKPKHRNERRVWYLKGVCVREAREGPVPHRIVMHNVRRRFTPPAKVAAGAADLGRPHRKLVTVQYCHQPGVLEMVEADRARRAGD